MGIRSPKANGAAHVAVIIAALLGTSCGSDNSIDVDTSVSAARTGVPMCHRKVHDEGFVLITVVSSAYDIHLAHGDHPYTEVDDCDGIDNDCDGIVDEDFSAETTACGVGECRATATTACIDGIVVDSCSPGVPSEEVCDALDNDCDGYVDEGGVCSTPECQPASCGTYTNCASDGDTCSGTFALCVRTAEGGSACVRDTFCIDLPFCTTSADCAVPGSVCAVDTCCGAGVCFFPSQLCTYDGSTLVSLKTSGTKTGPTASGR